MSVHCSSISLSIKKKKKKKKTCALTKSENPLSCFQKNKIGGKVTSCESNWQAVRRNVVPGTQHNMFAKEKKNETNISQRQRAGMK
jgi:hypothetical protein